MYYSFESEAVSETHLSLPIPYNTGSNFAQDAFTFSDTLPFVGAGGTLFFKHFYLDVGGQFASNGRDSAAIPFSTYTIESVDLDNNYVNTRFMAADPLYQARFERKELAISLGRAIGRNFSLFAGYKWAETNFDTTYRGTVSAVTYHNDIDLDGKSGHQLWGDVDYRFKYEGPFIGAVQGWEIGRGRFYEGTLTASLALAYLKGEVILDHSIGYISVGWHDDEPRDGLPVVIPEGGLANRHDTEGRSLGLTFGLGWRGKTKIEGLDYYLGLSAYRYEFDAQEDNESNINEDVLAFKGGLSYAFGYGSPAQTYPFKPDGAPAQGWEWRPRVETGAMYYSIERGATSNTVPTSQDEPIGYNETQQADKYSDIMGFAAAGATLFFNRMFLDLSVRSAGNGEDHARSSESTYDEDMGSGEGSFVAVNYHRSGQFERMEQAVSAGYALSDRLSLFAGYKWDELDLDIIYDGPFSYLDIESWVGHGTMTGREVTNFKYEGPFVGITNGWVVDGPAFLKGMASVNLAIAFLNSELSRTVTGQVEYTSINGTEIEPIGGPFSESTIIHGDTMGMALSLNWHGTTWINNLSYSLGLSGYRYQFESDNPEDPDIRETVATFKVGLAYSF